ncbi:hypothetical protein HS125_13855 [bacterium]|nr:hypothetical protein [bacterium]
MFLSGALLSALLWLPPTLWGQDFLSVPPGRLELAGYDSFMVLLTGMDVGLLEQSDCHPGEEGGLEPKVNLVEQLVARQLPCLFLDLGDTVPRASPRAEAVSQTILSTLDRLGCHGMLVAESELTSLPLAVMEQLARRVRLPMLAANLARIDGGTPYWKPWTKVQLGGITVGVIGLVPERIPLSDEDPYRITPRAEALARLLPRVKLEVDKVIVLTQKVELMSPPLYPEVDVWISADARYTYRYAGAEQPILFLPDGESYLTAFVLRYPKGEGRLIVIPQALWLSVRQYRHEPTRATVTALYRDLTARGLAPELEGALAGQPEESAVGAAYVGSASCQPCHAGPYAQWKATPHAHATATLADRERDFWPECLTCHSTGFGAPTGYRVASASPELAGVGCETCHGPGARHVAEPRRDHIRNNVTPLSPDVCKSCHDRAHDPRFEDDFLVRFANVMHEKVVHYPHAPQEHEPPAREP